MPMRHLDLSDYDESDPQRIGWILIHVPEEYGEGKTYTCPQDELRAKYKPGHPLAWSWSWSRPPREGGPYKLLFAWQGKVFGEATAEVSHSPSLIEHGPEIEHGRYNFAFVLRDYQEVKPVELADILRGDRRLVHHRSLIKLDDRILETYRTIAGGPR